MKRSIILSTVFIGLLNVSSFVLGSGTALAQNMPSQAQLEQLRALPRAQQEQLARQFGIDLSMLDQLERQEGRDTEQEQQDSNVVFPRGTRFDRDGDPIIPENLEREFSRDRDELKPFGYDLFAAQPRTFAPLSHAPVPTNYILGVGDTLRVQLFGKESQTFDVNIDREGKIMIPALGELTVVGLSYQAAKELIRHRVNDRLIGYQVAVSMGELRSIQIFIVGEAYQPGAYTVSSLSTVSQALYVAGGVSDIASLRNIRLMRGGQVESEFDLYDLLMRGDASADKLLQSGDVVFIPPRGEMITVKGEVTRPALYELKGGETLADALRLAGGAKPEAYLESTSVRRVNNGRRQMSTLDLTSSEHLAREVRGGDVIELTSPSDFLDASILLVGAVSRPGNYEWREGMRVNDVLRNSRHDLLEQADLSFGLVVREEGARRELKVFQFDVAKAIEGAPEENLSLLERDQLIIFSRYQTREEEEKNLSRLTLTQQDREREEREVLLREYRRAFLQDLVRDIQRNEEDEENARQEREQRRVPLRQLFGNVEDEEEEVAEEDLAEYSRERLLEPLMGRLQRQRTERGNTPFVYVAGEVNHPGMYPLFENASASRLIAAAGGLKDSAYLQRAEVTRVSISDGEARTEYIPFELSEVLQGNLEIALQGRDRLNILSIPDWQNTYEVTLRGEVRFPGTYAIRRGESLTNLIERAGGFTDFAFLEGAVFTREELREQERQRMNMLAEELQREIASNAITGTGGSTQSYEQMRTLLADLLAVQPVGRLIIDLPRIVRGESSAGDIQLKDGDSIHIPSRHDSISIMGEVQMATSYRFDHERSVNEYISMSGGTKQKADTDRVYVVRSNGSIEPHRQRRGWFSNSGSVQLRPGDTIVVPLDTTYTENLELWSRVTGIIYNSAVAIAAINSI